MLLAFVCGCDPVAMAPDKTNVPANNPSAVQAKRAFREALRAGQYDALPEVTSALTTAYVADPRDAELALLAGHAHLWRLAERSRLAAVPATITDEAVLAAHYFDQAKAMRPEDSRIDGWFGSTLLALGAINDDEHLRRKGYFALKSGASAYPEFNHFTFGYAMSTVPVTHERWPEVVRAMWESVDVCAGSAVSREVPDYARYASAQAEERDRSGARRVCWNSALAPHNFEGFFLQGGDVLVKNGQPDAAIRMYENARLSRSYASWPHRDALERRISSARARAERFRTTGDGEMMVDSPLACTGCHEG
jgi:hypothetical protein